MLGNKTFFASLYLLAGAGLAFAQLSANPTSLSFSCTAGGALPASQSIQLTASGGAAVSFTVESTSSGNWLSVTPTSGTTPATLTVAVNPSGLAVGNYSATITAGGTVIPIFLTVSSTSAVSANPTSLSFSYAAGGTVPPAQSIQLTAAGNAAVPFTVQWGTAAWLSVAPNSGTTPASLAVSVSALGLAAGSYSANIVINNTLTIPVSLTVNYPSTLPVISAVLNAASYASGAVSPGEIVSIFGTLIGPANPALLTLDATGKVSTSLGGVLVSFSGYAAPLTYVSSTQINAIVPYEVASLSSPPFVEVSYSGETSNAIGLHVTTTVPGIFTVNSTGTGPGAILNADSTLNTEQNPAAKGSAIQIFMTGEGLTTPAQATGAVTPVNTSGNGPLTPAPQGDVSVTIGGQPAKLDFAGEAPYAVAGVLQVNAEVPAAAASGAIPIVVKAGEGSSQSGVTVWVQ